MQGTALLLLTITISVSMLLNSSFTLEKKINSNPRCTLTTEVNKKSTRKWMTFAEFNANKENLLFSVICIRIGTCQTHFSFEPCLQDRSLDSLVLVLFFFSSL